MLIHYQENDCPGDVNKGPVPTWQIVLTRPYLRAAPGRLVSVVSSGPERTLTAVGTAATTGATVDLWVPGTSTPVVGGIGVARVRVVAVTGGFRVALTACGADYTVQVGSGAAAAPAACPAAAPTTVTTAPTGTAATPVEAQPTFTG